MITLSAVTRADCVDKTLVTGPHCATTNPLLLSQSSMSCVWRLALLAGRLRVFAHRVTACVVADVVQASQHHTPRLHQRHCLEFGCCCYPPCLSDRVNPTAP